MKYIFSRYISRTIIAVCLLVASFGLVSYVIYSYNGNTFATIGLTLIACAMLSYSSRTLMDLYGQINGNRRRYRLEPALSSKNTRLSKMAQDYGFKLKKYNNTEFYVCNATIFSGSSLVTVSGKFKESVAFRFRLRQLAYYFRLWQEKRRTAAKSLVSVLSRDPNEMNTYIVSSLGKEGLQLEIGSFLSSIVDQKLLGRKITLTGTEVADSLNLLEDGSGQIILKFPQETDLVSAVYLQVLFVTADGYIVPNERIERNFASYCLSGCIFDCDTFCSAQVTKHLGEDKQIAELGVIGLGLIIEDLGALALVCGVKLKVTWNDVMVSCGLENLPKMTIDEAMSEEKKMTAAEALMWFCVKNNARWLKE